MVKGVLRVLQDNRVAFYCPGCKSYHEVNINGTNHPVWTFNGDYNKPTFSPSILVRSGHYTGREDKTNCWCTYAKEHPDEDIPFKCGICHSFITDGKIQFLGDCTHELAGQTVELTINDLGE